MAHVWENGELITADKLNSAIFEVDIEMQNDQWVSNKTFNEIKAAYDAGALVLFHSIDGLFDEKYIVSYVSAPFGSFFEVKDVRLTSIDNESHIAQFSVFGCSIQSDDTVTVTITTLNLQIPEI